MQRLFPASTRWLAKAVADSLVVAVDGAARHASVVYWEWSRPWVGAVVEAAAGAPEEVRAAAKALLDDHRSYARHQQLRQALVECAERDPERLDDLFDHAWLAETNVRLGYHIGSGYGTNSDALTWQELSGPQPHPAEIDLERAPVLIVIPFRDDSSEGLRIRNLLACLAALRDQSFERARYRVTVVESDSRPRWQAPIRRLCDQYVFAPKTGAFNKAWAVNAGVVNAPGTVELICVLDADILTDREFVARNVRRFLSPGGVGAIIPYRDTLSLDAESSAAAIRDRVLGGSAAAEPGLLRGFLLRRPPGGCIWLRANAFSRVGGMDERYEGWGGEDNDFVFRVDFDTPLDRYDDTFLHLHHPSAERSAVNAQIPPLSWKPDAAIGDVNRFGSP